MHTETLTVDPFAPGASAITRAADCLRRGGLVAFPTETVYGLGVDALNQEAVRRLFAAKKRPANDPLIVHVTSIDAAEKLVIEISAVARALAARFWPGPLTLILPRSLAVPDEVTAGLESVAIRVPAHPVAQALLRAARIPVAAPSANLFSRPSPTTAAHVLADLDGRIDMVVDGGSTTVGLESTVVDLSQVRAVVLRPGAIGLEALTEFLPGLTTPVEPTPDAGPQRSPGLLEKHYSPAVALTLYEGSSASAAHAMATAARTLRAEGRAVAILSFTEDDAALQTLGVPLVNLGAELDPADVALRLYSALRACERLAVDVVLVRTPTSDDPLSVAVRDRLRRAAASVVRTPS